MRTRTTARWSALALTIALVATGAPAFAVEDDSPPPASAARVSVTTPGVLTLPWGDGVRDAAAVTVAADLPTVVELSVRDSAGRTLAALPAATLVEGALSAVVSVPVAGLPAGAHSLVAAPAAGEEAVAPLRVGSGKPAAVTLGLSARTVYTWSKSAARTTVATVTAADETGLAIPFRGFVEAKVGTRTQRVTVASAGGAAATATLSGTGLVAGTARVIAAVTANGSNTVTSAPASLVVKNVAVTAIRLSSSSSVVYPTKDGYKDSVALSLSSRTTTGSTVPVTGTVKVTSRGKTVKTWKLSTSKPWKAAWDGKVKGKVVPGTYVVTASVKGPEGVTKKTSKKVTVRKGVLVTKTTSAWVSAQSAFDLWLPLDGCAPKGAASIRCAGSDEFMSAIVIGELTVPSAVRKSYAYGSAAVRVTLSTTSLDGSGVWGYARPDAEVGKTGMLSKGDRTLGWETLARSARTVQLIAVLMEDTDWTTDKVRIEYRYKVLSTK